MSCKNVKPVIVILGATGTGKSKLGIEVASKFNGEIISADSMQLYKGLDITTNKVTAEEQATIKHHMINIIDPQEEYSVVEFRNEALSIIDNLHKDGKLPVLVGGTHYYAESVLWNVLIQKNEPEIRRKEGKCDDPSITDDTLLSIHDINQSKAQEMMSNYLNLSNEDIMKKLNEIDPDVASRYHPNERRKILRSLEVWHQTGVLHSTHIRKQLDEVKGSDLGGSIRYPNAIVLWITCEKSHLDKRLDGRVDTMMERGMLEELTEFHHKYSSILNHATPDDDRFKERYSRGLFQNIGLKEFHRYLCLSKDQKETDRGIAMYKKAIDNMKLRTRQYSRNQNKWMRSRFLGRQRLQVPVYALDGNNIEDWDKRVKNPSIEIIEDILDGKEPSHSKIKTDPVERNNTKHVCEICNRVFMGDLQYKAHIEGARHRRTLKRKSKAKPIDEELKHLKTENTAVS